MNNFQKLFVFLVILSIKIIPSMSTCSEDNLYIIKNVFSELVLDGSEISQVKVQLSKGTDGQLWKFVRGSRPELFYIVNHRHGLVLDFVRRGVWDHTVFNNREDSWNQQWKFADNGCLVNVGKQQNLDIFRENFTAGAIVVVHPENNRKNQQFVVHKV